MALGGLFSAIFNEVLQFFLIWFGALLIPILGLVETGGWSGMVARIHQNFPGQDYTHMWRPIGPFHRQSHGHPLDRHCLWSRLGVSFGYWTTDFLVVQRVLAAKDVRAAKMAPIIGSFFKMAVPFIVILPGLLGARLLAFQSRSGERDAAGPAQLQRSPAADAGALLRTGTAWAGDHCADRRLHVGHGGQRQRLRHRLDLRHLPAFIRKDASDAHYVAWAAGARSSGFLSASAPLTS